MNAGGRTFGEVLAALFSSRPPPTGNPDVDELYLYNYLASTCDQCGASPAHRHGEIYQCDPCCQRRAAAVVNETLDRIERLPPQ